jgi:hypothetical protein
MKFLDKFLAATQVVQDPAAKSIIKSHSFVYVFIKSSIRATGF